MTLPFLFILNGVLFTRLCLFRDDAVMTWRRALLISTVEWVFLIAPFGCNSWLLIAGADLTAINLVGVFLDRCSSKKSALCSFLRLVMFALTLAVLGVCFSASADISFRPVLGQFMAACSKYVVFVMALRSLDWQWFFLNAAGVLLCLKEANLVVRLLLTWLKVVPPSMEASGVTDSVIIRGTVIGVVKWLKVVSPSTGATQDEGRRGSIIGMLERVFVYSLVLQGQYAALGLIMTAKTFIRFREFRDKDFAEYVLIGTLASVGLAGAVALLFRSILGL